MSTPQVIAGTNFSFPGQQGVYHGKVRDVYDMGDSLLFVATDRYSAFDRNLALIPYKGELLTATSRWWFEQTSSIVPNHVMSYPDPNVTWGKKCKVIPIEMIVRGYITGVTNTSLWHTYSRGQREYGEFTLPNGLQKNDKLPEPVLTPTTKFEEHDRPLTPIEAVKEGLLDVELWDRLRKAALELFAYGQKTAESKGLILVDTKYEFGLDEQNNLVLIDELHTQDSSRYWNAETYQDEIKKGQEPANYDKEFLRLWYKTRFNPYEDHTVPQPSLELLNNLIHRYAFVYEKLSGQPFLPEGSPDPVARIQTNVQAALQEAEMHR